MTRILRKFRQFCGEQGEQGSTVIETAVVLPTFLLLLFGFFEYSFGLTAYMNATYAARVGARYASLHSLSSGSPATQDQVKSVVLSQLFVPGAATMITAGNIIVDYGDRMGSTAGAGNYQGDLVGVGIIWYQKFDLPFLPSKSIYIATQAYRVIER